MRHKKNKKTKTETKTKITEQNSPMFELKLDFRDFTSIRKTFNRA